MLIQCMAACCTAPVASRRLWGGAPKRAVSVALARSGTSRHTRAVRFSRRVLLLAATGVAVTARTRRAAATQPSPDLMKRLARYAAAFEAMKTQASYAIDGALEELDSDLKPTSVKAMRARVDADGSEAKF